jgi:hypothetical protein
MAKKLLRIATLGDFARWNSYYLQGTIQGSILNGALHCSIPIRQYVEDIESQINYFKPHILFCHMIFSENLTTLCRNDEPDKQIRRENIHQTLSKIRRRWGTKVVYQEGDAKKDPRYPYPATEIIDLGLINNSLFKVYGGLLKVPCIHWPYFALNQDEISIPDNSLRCQMAFTGNVSPRGSSHLHYGRYEFIEKLKKRLEFKAFPNESLGNTRFLTADLAVSASTILGIQQGFNVVGYLDTRPFQYIGAGALYFHDKSPAMDLFFEEGKHYVGYNRFDVDSVVEKYYYYMKDNRELGNKIREEGFRYVQAHHTAKHRVKMVIDILEGKDVKHPIYLNDIRGEDENI